MVEIRDASGKVKSRSQNLRGLVRAFGKRPVEKVVIDRLPDGRGKLLVLFCNKDSCETNFASFVVLQDWALGRRNLRGVPITVNGG